MTLAIRSIAVPRQHRQIAQGQSVDIYAYISDVGLTDILVNPMDTPLITLYAPDGTVLVSDADMVNNGVGVWHYVYQTTMASALGIYTATIKAIDDSDVAVTDKRMVFKVRYATALASFTYFAIQDQTGVVWYWYVNNSNELTVSATVPSILGKQAVLIVQGTVPRWLEVNNPTPALRYIYPDVTGDALVSATQPPVGTGRVGSPTVVADSGGSYVLSLNVSDEVILNLV